MKWNHDIYGVKKNNLQSGGQNSSGGTEKILCQDGR
jgi:hypothetical protein